MWALGRWYTFRAKGRFAEDAARDSGPLAVCVTLGSSLLSAGAHRIRWFVSKSWSSAAVVAWRTTKA